MSISLEIDQNQNLKSGHLLEHLYVKYYKLVEYVAFLILREKFWAEDAAQEVFIKIYRNLVKFYDLDDTNCKRLIVCITKNVSKDIYNKNRNMIYFEDCSSALFFKDDNFIYKIDYENMICEIKKLNPIYRDVILFKLSGYRDQEIAFILNISKDNVRKRFERAKRMILEKNDKDCHIFSF